MAGKRKAKFTPFQPKRAQDNSTATSQAAKKTTRSASKNAQNNPSSSPVGLLNIPPELRNSICRYATISEEPIEVTFNRNRHSGRYYFTMMPALTLVSKQLRLETQHLFFEQNEFHVRSEVLQQRGALPALHAMHQRIGLELQSIHVSHSIMRRHRGRNFQVEAQLSLTKDEEGRIASSKQAYTGKSFNKSSPVADSPYIRYMEVCGCRVERLVRSYNNHSGIHHITDVLQLLDQQSRGRPICPTRDVLVIEEIASNDLICRDCSTQDPPWIILF